jgi:hypothetical protein
MAVFKAFLVSFFIVIFVLHCAQDGDKKPMSEQDKKFFYGGTKAERDQIKISCENILIGMAKEKFYGGQYDWVYIKTPQVGYLATEPDGGGNVYLFESTQKTLTSQPTKFHFYCQRINDPKKGWQDLDVEINEYQ